MKIGRKKHYELEVFSATMNDIMFFLMLFFLIISTLANPNVIKVLLPKSGTTDTYSKQDITLTVNANKQYFIGDNEVPFALLEQELNLATASSEDKVVVLRADATLTIQDLVDVLQIGAKNHVRIVMATDKSNF